MAIFYQNRVRLGLAKYQEIEFRTILAEDKQRIEQGFHLLSNESRYLRFFTYLKELSPAQLTYLSEVDQVNHVAWGAIDLGQNPDLGLGVGRFIRLDEAPDSAELAITVIDSYQGKGFGNVLFAIMYLLAKPNQVDYFVGSVLPENAYVLEKLRDMNARIRFDGNVYQFRLPICQDIEMCTQSPSVQSFKFLLQEVKNKLFDHNPGL